MTTIATDGKVIAADSRVTQENIIATDKQKKIFRGRNGSVFGWGGDHAEFKKFKKWCLDGRHIGDAPELDGFGAIEVTPSGKIYGYENL